jgi:hydrogenase expression/formation protein HypE
MGKLSTAELKAVLRCIKSAPKIVVPPTVGLDCGVHQITDNTCMVITTDPCLGVPLEWFGWFLIHYAASDVAVFGAKPEYAAINLLGPPKTRANVFKKIMQQACETANELGMNIITGHTGTYGELAAVMGTCTAYGFVQKNKLITPAGAKSHDYIVCIKPIGLETLVNFALTNRLQARKLFGGEAALSLAAQIKMQTCVREALLLAEVEGVSAMHDATEGGFLMALNEIADASSLGFSIDFSKLPMTRELQLMRRHFHLSGTQIMSASSTGTLLAAVSPRAKDEVIKSLSQGGIVVESVGVFTEDKERVITYDGRKCKFPLQSVDPYVKIMSTKLC